MAVTEEDQRLLQPAVEAARRALRRLDEDEIPGGLRRVAGSSARRLPPPLLRGLIEDLEGSEWLRERSLAEFDDADPESGDEAVAASSLFLLRPEGWEVRLARLRELVELRAGRRRRGALEHERDRLSRRVAALEEDLAAARTAVDQARRSQEDRVDEDLERLRHRNLALRRQLDESEGALSAATRMTARLREDLAEADARILELREDLLKARRGRDSTGVEGGRAFGRGSPAQMARALDDLHASLLPSVPAPATSASPQPVRFPEGTRPDRREAVEWLLAVRRPLTLLVDGYNVAFELVDGPDAPAADTRDRVADELARLRRLAAGPIRCVVFWDTRYGSERWDERGVDVRFVESADDAIVEECARTTSAVVVSGDREVRERAEAVGAISLWSAALADWMRR